MVSSHTESTMWPGSRAVSDLELLQIEIDMLWGINQARLIDGPDLVVACASTGVFATVSKAVPEDVARAVLGEVADVRVLADISAPPPLLERWRRLLEDVLGEIELAPGSGPSYLIEDHVAFPASIPLVRSDAEDFGRLRGANPGNWGDDEWQDLLDGRRGPWVMARHADHVISICHTPVSSTRAAEAGVWTHPDFRGHGYAAATTAEWAALVRPSGRLLFYSTSRTNWSSQKVAARLGLRPIGFRWQLRRLCPRAGT